MDLSVQKEKELRLFAKKISEGKPRIKNIDDIQNASLLQVVEYIYHNSPQRDKTKDPIEWTCLGCGEFITHGKSITEAFRNSITMKHVGHCPTKLAIKTLLDYRSKKIK